MASYIAQGSYTTVKSYAPGTSITVQMITFQTQPTGIWCEYGVPYEAFLQEGTGASDQPLIQSLADTIENIALRVSCVTGGTFIQDVDPSSGLLVDYVQFFLSYTPASGAGPFTTTVDVPVAALASAADIAEFGNFIPPGTYTAPVDQVATACASLQALANG